MFGKRILIHLIFWMAITAVSLYFKLVIHHFSYRLVIATTFDILLLALFSYLNIYVIARFYEKRKVLAYFGVVLTLVTVISLFRYQLELSVFDLFKIDFISFGTRLMAAKVLTTLIFLGISFAYYLSINYLKRKQEAFVIEAQHLQLEIDFHKSRVNPHFLFNTLGNIHAMILQKSDNAADAVLELSDLMRYMFYDCQEEKVRLSKEMDFIHSFINLYRIRSTNELNIVFKKECTKDLFIEPLLFVSFIENVFKHGNIYQGGTLTVSFIEKQNSLTFICENTYDSDFQNQHKKQSGFGIKNVQKRVSLLYPNKHQLEVKKGKNLFTIKLILTLTPEKNEKV